MKRKLYISINASSNNEALIKIKGSISNWRNSADGFEQKVDDLITDGVKNVRLYINSGGGSVFEANEIVNIIQKFPGTITAELGALCASAATVIAMSANNIEMASNGQFMIHRPMAWVEGNEDELSSSLKLLRTLQANFLVMYSDKTGMTTQEISDLWRTDYWMDAKEAKEKGFIDSIIGKTEKADAEDIKALMSVKMYKNIPQSLVALAQPKTAKTEKNNNMKVIALTLGLSADAKEEHIQAALESLQAKANQSETYKTELEDLKNSIQANKVDTLIANAIKDKKILASQKAQYVKLATSDFETTKSIIDGTQAAVVITDSIVPITDANKSFDDYSPAELEAMADSNPDQYEALIKNSLK